MSWSNQPRERDWAAAVIAAADEPLEDAQTRADDDADAESDEHDDVDAGGYEDETAPEADVPEWVSAAAVRERGER